MRTGSPRPKKLRHKKWFDPNDEPFDNERDAYRALVWQCRYSGIEVPDALWAQHSPVKACPTAKIRPNI